MIALRISRDDADRIKEAIGKYEIRLGQVVEDKGEAHSGGDVFHDPVFQGLERQEMGLCNQLEKLRGTLEGADIIDPKQAGFVDVGNVVVLEREGATLTYLVTGTALVPRDDIDVVSTESPLGRKLLGAHVGMVVRYDVRGEARSVRVVEIRLST